MKKILALVWLVIPPLLFSALIHAVDPDVGGISGLASPTTLSSVLFFGLPLVTITIICFALAIRFRWVVWVSVSAAFSAVVALGLVLLLVPDPRGFGGIARPLVGGTVLGWLFLAIAILPARALGWPARSRRSEPAA